MTRIHVLELNAKLVSPTYDTNTSMGATTICIIKNSPGNMDEQQLTGTLAINKKGKPQMWKRNGKKKQKTETGKEDVVHYPTKEVKEEKVLLVSSIEPSVDARIKENADNDDSGSSSSSNSSSSYYKDYALYNVCKACAPPKIDITLLTGSDFSQESEYNSDYNIMGTPLSLPSNGNQVAGIQNKDNEPDE
jgi:hypothetical protein